MDFSGALGAIQGKGPGRMIPDLDRITALSELLGDPQRAYPSVHITGTNGKTSVTRIVTTLFAAAGVSAGTYTSPHLQSARERLSVAGRAISRRQFTAVYEELAPFIDLVDTGLEHPDDHVTYFETLTAMAYAWFADFPVDVGVFEVGMGGRWDATNLVRGEVAVLTPIDVDHRQLGATPAEVAGEKVGIIKDGAIVVSAEQTEEVLAVIEDEVERRGATFYRMGRDIEVTERAVAVGGQQMTVRIGERVVTELFLPLFGEHQASNAALALGGFAAFMGDGFAAIDDDLLREAFTAIVVPGRLEVISSEPTIVLDGAHNPHGARTAVGALEESFGFRNLVVVLASLADKDLRGIVAPYRDVANHVVVTAAPSPRSASVATMEQIALEVFEGTGVIVETARSLPEALEKATGVAGEGDGVLVTGSLYTVGAARELYRPVEDTDEVIPNDHDAEDGDDGDDIDLTLGDDEIDDDAFNAAVERMIDGIGDDDLDD